MPELMSHSDGRAWELEQFREQYMAGANQKTSSPYSRGTSYTDKISLFHQQLTPGGHDQSPKKSKSPRGKETSRHFGVRFRPDLQKWVAEIRVAEWKSVDKKVWLGTFDTEEGAARAVDAARKLLKCKKKRLPNFPCDALVEYEESIPGSLDLNNLTQESMFKEVTLFVKHKAQEYAASFYGPCKASPCLSDQLPLAAPMVLVHPLNSDMASHRLFTLPEDDMSPSGYSPSSYESYGTEFPSYEAVVMGDVHNWNHPTSVTYSRPSSCSSVGTSPIEEDWSWVHVAESSNMCYSRSQEQLTQMDGGIRADDSWMSLGAPSQGSWEDPAMDALFDDLMFDIEGDQEQCHVDDPNVMNIFHRDEVQMLYEESQNNTDSWMSGPLLQQQNFNLPGYHSLSNSMEYNAQVC